jgi:hypothetical protein
MRGTLFAGQFTKDHLYALALQIALDDSQMRDISRQPIHIVNQNNLEAMLVRVITKLVERGSSQKAAAPALVLISVENRPFLFMRKALQFRHLGVYGLPFSLLLCRDSTVERDTQVWELIALHCFSKRLFGRVSLMGCRFILWPCSVFVKCARLRV